MLLRPYEQRPWAQTNWILVRLWKGDGYGFRYTETPHQQQQFYPKMAGEGVSHTNHIKPCPSKFYQDMVAAQLVKDPETSKVELKSARLTLHSTKLCTKFKIFRNKIIRCTKVTVEAI
jgi:Kip1 ubiquitination-promoting complex protein 1